MIPLEGREGEGGKASGTGGGRTWELKVFVRSIIHYVVLFSSLFLGARHGEGKGEGGS